LEVFLIPALKPGTFGGSHGEVHLPRNSGDYKEDPNHKEDQADKDPPRRGSLGSFRKKASQEDQCSKGAQEVTRNPNPRFFNHPNGGDVGYCISGSVQGHQGRGDLDLLVFEKDLFGHVRHPTLTGVDPLVHEQETVAAYAEIGLQALVVWEEEVASSGLEGLRAKLAAFLG